VNSLSLNSSTRMYSTQLPLTFPKSYVFMMGADARPVQKGWLGMLSRSLLFPAPLRWAVVGFPEDFPKVTTRPNAVWRLSGHPTENSGTSFVFVGSNQVLMVSFRISFKVQDKFSAFSRMPRLFQRAIGEGRRFRNERDILGVEHISSSISELQQARNRFSFKCEVMDIGYPNGLAKWEPSAF
jgi:hypothetical protein